LRLKIARIGAGGGGGTELPGGASLDASLGASLDHALGGGLRRGALHEIAPARAGDGAAASGFALALAARFAAGAAKGQCNIIWIVENASARENGAPYGAGIALHGVDPARLVLVHTLNAKESLWSMEEALKCRAAAVIGEIWSFEKAYGLAASRRLALAAQKCGTPGLLLAAGMAGRAERLSSSAQTRFEIFARAGSSFKAPSFKSPPMARGLPPPGLACWSVKILKARAGAQPPGFGRDEVHAVLWDHEKACFRDAFPLPLSSHAGHRPDHKSAPAGLQARLRNIA
jgi:protein ImuA